MNGPGRQKLAQGRNSWQCENQAWVSSDLLQALMGGGHLSTLGFRVQELCESRGGRPGLPVLTSLLVSVDVKRH